VQWGRSIYKWLGRNRQHSVNSGGALAVAVFHLYEKHPQAVIDTRYDAFDPLVDSNFSSRYEAVFIFRFYDRTNGRVYTLEVDSRGELRGLSERPLGPFE